MFSYKLLYPNHFFLSRGNHESDVMNKVSRKIEVGLSEFLWFRCTASKERSRRSTRPRWLISSRKSSACSPYATLLIEKSLWVALFHSFFHRHYRSSADWRKFRMYPYLETGLSWWIIQRGWRDSGRHSKDRPSSAAAWRRNHVWLVVVGP